MLGTRLLTRHIHRRTFLKSAAASIPAIASFRAHGADTPPPSKQVTLGCIGLGIHGLGWNLDAFLKIPEARVLAVCDVYRYRQEIARDKVNAVYTNNDCDIYTDFREILARDDIDAVVISTPDHWHVPMSIMAARAGKDVFCEKPTYCIGEGPGLIETIKSTNVVYQGGIEDRSVEQYYRIAQIARDGILGDITRIEVTLPEGEVFPKEDPEPVPDGLDYDMWLGPAPYSPYTKSKLGAQQWRNHWDYSGGKLTDWGAHLIDTAQIAIFEEHGGPVEIDGKGEFPKDALSTTATKYEIHYTYKSGAVMTVKSGGTGIRVEGEKGWVSCPAWRKPLEASDPKILEAKYDPSASKIWPQPVSEHPEFINKVLERGTPYYTPADIHHLSATMHLGNISMRLGRKLKWNPNTESFDNDPEATTYLPRTYRAPWTV